MIVEIDKGEVRGVDSLFCGTSPTAEMEAV